MFLETLENTKLENTKNVIINKCEIKLEVRKENELFQNEIDLVGNAELKNLAPIEAWTSLGTNTQLSYSTHGIFRYFGKFPPPIATHLITKYTNKNDLVLDPMCGSGTTGVESLLLERNCILNDINPLSLLLSRVKTRYISYDMLIEAVNRISNYYKFLNEIEYKFEPIGLKNANHWFLSNTKNSLRGIRKLIEEEKNEYVKEFLWVIFAATVRRVSRATTQQGRLFLDVETALEDALPMFLKKAGIGIKGVSSLPNPSRTNIKVLSYDLQVGLPKEYIEKAKLIILHPPYFNSYKYSSINSLELSWLGIDYNEIRKKEVREFFKLGKPEKVVYYVEDMFKVIINTISLLQNDGILAIMIGDTIMKGTHIPVTKMLIDKIRNYKLQIETIALRVPKYTEATWVTSQRRKTGAIGTTLYDYIIIFRRIN